MALLRHLSKKFSLNTIPFINNPCKVCSRQLNYTSKEYDNTSDPSPYFFNEDIQSLLKTLTRVDLSKVHQKRKLGYKRLEDPTYKFMTSAQLEEAISEAKSKADELLQIPPVIPVHKPVEKVLSKDPALQGYETCKLVFTDITFGLKDSERLMVVRDTDGTLKEAEWELRNRINQTYFPKPGKSLKPPRMFEDRYLESLLDRKEYLFILDSACSQFEPNEAEYQKATSITYQHINDNNNFNLLRSTRHFGSLVFFLVWHKMIDNLLLDLIETSHIHEANTLMNLYGKVHKVSLESDGNLKSVEEYIEKYSTKRGALELAVQAYKDVSKQRQELEQGIKKAHGLN